MNIIYKYRNVAIFVRVYVSISLCSKRGYEICFVRTSYRYVDEIGVKIIVPVKYCRYYRYYYYYGRRNFYRFFAENAEENLFGNTVGELSNRTFSNGF